MFTGKSQNNFSAAVVFSVSIGLFFKPLWSHLEPASSADTSSRLFPTRGPCPPVYQLCTPTHPRLIPSQAPWGPLLWQISQGLQEGCWGPLGTAHQSPTFGSICKLLSEGVRVRPQTGCSCYHHCLQIGLLFPADLPVSGKMRKVRDKTGFYGARGSFLVQKGRKYLCGILFFFPPSSSKKYKETLCLKCECRL